MPIFTCRKLSSSFLSIQDRNNVSTAFKILSFLLGLRKCLPRICLRSIITIVNQKARAWSPRPPDQHHRPSHSRPTRRLAESEGELSPWSCDSGRSRESRLSPRRGRWSLEFQPPVPRALSLVSPSPPSPHPEGSWCASALPLFCASSFFSSASPWVSCRALRVDSPPGPGAPVPKG